MGWSRMGWSRKIVLGILAGSSLQACAQTPSNPSANQGNSTSAARAAEVGSPAGELAEATRALVQAERRMAEKAYEQAVEAARQASQLAPRSANHLQRAAEIMYRCGDSAASLELFDRVVELAPETAPFNWQRGIALCSCQQFEKAAEQFKAHHQVNPDDVENSAWYFLCVAKTKGVPAAESTVIPSRGDARQPMMSVLKMLRGELEPDQVMQAAIEHTTEGATRRQAQFYADLYIGLYLDSLGQPDSAQRHLQRSLGYGHSGYMADVARVYLADRFGKSTPQE